MFKVALQNSKGSRNEATAICNYAVFLFRNKKRPEEAAALFCDGLDR
jgi:Tfp pilus assembly protein PilF